MRLIDADAFWNLLQQVVYDIFTYPAEGEQYAHVGYYTETIAEALKRTPTIEATPCSFCRYNPPSSGDGKPCTICPASAKEMRDA